MARAKKQKEWMAIVTISYRGDDYAKPVVIYDDDMETVATFSSPEAIEKLSEKHILGPGVWTAFNFTTGEAVSL